MYVASASRIIYLFSGLFLWKLRPDSKMEFNIDMLYSVKNTGLHIISLKYNTEITIKISKDFKNK